MTELRFFNKSNLERMNEMETKRLLIRHIQESDVNDFYEFAQNEHIGPQAGWAPHTHVAESVKVLKNICAQEHHYALVYKENNKMIGTIAIHIDKRRQNPKAGLLGFVLHEAYWNQGLMQECVARIQSFVFETLHMEILSVAHYPDNRRSKRVIEKCGFQFEGTMRKVQLLYDGSVKDLSIYSMLKEEYEMYNHKLEKTS